MNLEFWASIYFIPNDHANNFSVVYVVLSSVVLVLWRHLADTTEWSVNFLSVIWYQSAALTSSRYTAADRRPTNQVSAWQAGRGSRPTRTTCYGHPRDDVTRMLREKLYRGI